MSARPLFAVVAMCALMFAVGCQTNASPAAATSAPMTKAVIASTGNGTTTIFLPVSSGTGVQTLSTGGPGSPVCAQCAADAAAYFQTGTLAAKCPQCGASRVAALGHN